MPHYLDTSALVKLVVREAETDALVAWCDARSNDLVSSDLTRTELVRTVRRFRPELLDEAKAVLSYLELFSLTTSDYEAASRLDPAALRSLDSLHLTAAMKLGDYLESLVTYDDRLAEAAQANGIPVTRPTNY